MIKVLAVDDEAPIRQWLEFCINQIDGFQVVGIASHGAEGYSVFKKTMPDILITDIRMPGIDGLEMLKMVQSLNSSVYTIMLTSHEDFDYARKAIRLGAAEYILKTEITDQSLRELLEKAKKTIESSKKMDGETTDENISYRNQYLRSIVLKEKIEPLSEAMMAEYRIPLKNGPYFSIDILRRKEDNREKLSLPKYERVDNICMFSMDMEHTIVIANLKKGIGNSQVELMETCAEYCNLILNQKTCIIGCSDIFEKLESLSIAMVQAYDRAKLSFYRESTTLFCYSPAIRHKSSNSEKYSILFSKELVNQNYTKALYIKDEMLAEIQHEEPVDIDYVKKTIFKMITSLFYIIKEDIGDIEQQLDAIQKSINDCTSFKKMKSLINETFEESGAFLTEKNEYTVSIRNAIAYMSEHYGSPITLTEVSNYVGLSPEYLSRLFKDETGIKFVVYLNNLRLKNAVRLLDGTNLKVYEIAEQAGYSNLSYFSTVFKKNFGMNPFDYRNRK